MNDLVNGASLKTRGLAPTLETLTEMDVNEVPLRSASEQASDRVPVVEAAASKRSFKLLKFGWKAAAAAGKMQMRRESSPWPFMVAT